MIPRFPGSQAGVWVAESDDVPGIVAEADSPKVPLQKLKTLVPELLELEVDDCPAGARIRMGRETRGVRLNLFPKHPVSGYYAVSVSSGYLTAQVLQIFQNTQHPRHERDDEQHRQYKNNDGEEHLNPRLSDGRIGAQSAPGA